MEFLRKSWANMNQNDKSEWSKYNWQPAISTSGSEEKEEQA